MQRKPTFFGSCFKVSLVLIGLGKSKTKKGKTHGNTEIGECEIRMVRDH